MPHRSALLPLACACLMAGCAEQQSNTAHNQEPAPEQAATASGPVLPLTNDAAAQAGEPANATAPGNAGVAGGMATIPAALHGRWGLVPGDCTSTRGDAKGLVTISAEGIKFYESVARPAKIVERADSRIRGEFDFTGEGMEWTNPMIWSAAGDKLTRVDSEEDSRLVYTRC